VAEVVPTAVMVALEEPAETAETAETAGSVAHLTALAATAEMVGTVEMAVMEEKPAMVPMQAP
jgi:hypothetical protein